MTLPAAAASLAIVYYETNTEEHRQRVLKAGCWMQILMMQGKGRCHAIPAPTSGYAPLRFATHNSLHQ